VVGVLAGCGATAKTDDTGSVVWLNDCCTPTFNSVTVSAVDERGNANIGALVEWSVDGSDFLEAECARAAAGGACVAWAAGFEQTGTFKIRASASGYSAVEDSVFVDLSVNGCNVYPRTMYLVLEETDENP